jgi:hypothetical protein
MFTTVLWFLRHALCCLKDVIFWTILWKYRVLRY